MYRTSFEALLHLVVLFSDYLEYPSDTTYPIKLHLVA